ncbi:TPA: SPJ_0845 family protein [Streptococcus suis]
MAVTYKRQDDLEKMLEEFASFDKLEEIEFPDPKSKMNSHPETSTGEQN